MPDDSPTNQLGTDELSWLVPSKANVLSVSFLLGFGDGIFQNQICSLIGLLYPSERDAAARKGGKKKTEVLKTRPNHKVANKASKMAFLMASSSIDAFKRSFFGPKEKRVKKW